MRGNAEMEKKKLTILVGLLIIGLLLIGSSLAASVIQYSNNTASDEITNSVSIEEGEETQGNFIVGGKQEQINKDTESQEDDSSDIGDITFTGYGKYEVSEKYPYIELSNPEANVVNFVFTLSDKETGDIIAKTGKIAPGEYLYVDVMDYYKTAGDYSVHIVVETFDSDGNQYNGINQDMELTVS
jgi:hypothetical protein